METVFDHLFHFQKNLYLLTIQKAYYAHSQNTNQNMFVFMLLSSTLHSPQPKKQLVINKSQNEYTMYIATEPKYQAESLLRKTEVILKYQV